MSQPSSSTDMSFLGVAMSSPPSCISHSNGNTTVVDGAACTSAGLPAPANVRPCNRFPCPSAVVTWQVSTWSSCVAVVSNVSGSGTNTNTSHSASVTSPASGTPTHSVAPSPSPATCSALTVHQQTRTVTCVNGTGDAVGDVACASWGLQRPQVTQVCTVDPGTSSASSGGCACVTAADCAVTNAACVSHKCVCATGWGGVDCSVALITGTAGACVGGVVDVTGTCCTSGVDAATGVCCPQGGTVDRHGHCCANAHVDVCGVCGGNGVAVDVQGVCCTSALPPSGVCCGGSGVDSCGVCGGTDDCNTTVVLSLPGTAGVGSLNARCGTCCCQLVTHTQASPCPTANLMRVGGVRVRVCLTSVIAATLHVPVSAVVVTGVGPGRRLLGWQATDGVSTAVPTEFTRLLLAEVRDKLTGESGMSSSESVLDDVDDVDVNLKQTALAHDSTARHALYDDIDGARVLTVRGVGG